MFRASKPQPLGQTHAGLCETKFFWAPVHSSLTPARHLCRLAHRKGRAEKLQGHLHSPQGLESLLSDPLQIKVTNTCLETLVGFHCVCVLSIGGCGGRRGFGERGSLFTF